MLRMVVEALRDQKPMIVPAPIPQVPSEVRHETNISLGNYGNSHNSHTSQPQKASPKLEFAVQWLRQNPADMLRGGRDLENAIRMGNDTISYKWWNEAKKLVAGTRQEVNGAAD